MASALPGLMTQLAPALDNVHTPAPYSGDGPQPSSPSPQWIGAVTSDGATVMNCVVDLLNQNRHSRRLPLIKWVRDIAHCLMRGIATAKAGSKR